MISKRVFVILGWKIYNENQKKMLVLLLFMVAIIGVIAPVNGELYSGVGIKSLKAVENGKKNSA